MTATLASLTRDSTPTTIALNKFPGGWSGEVPETLEKDAYCVRFQAVGIDDYDLIDTRPDRIDDVLLLLRADEERDNNYYRKRVAGGGATLLNKRRTVAGGLVKLTEQ